MLMVTHCAVGTFIGENFSSVLTAFLIGLISHFLLDIIPHGDRHDTRTFKENPHHKKKMLTVVFVDSLALITFIYIYFSLYSQNQNSYLPSVIAGMAGAVIPDIMVAIHYLNKRFFFRLNYLHLKIHELINSQISFNFALLIQVLIFVFVFGLYKF